jgi:hypothetical protein
MYTLEQVLKPDFSRSWYEAVALVQEVARALGDLTTVPAAEDLYLEEDGTIAIGFASEVSRHPVTALAMLLTQLFQGAAAPAGLRSLADDNAKTPPAHDTIAAFSRALAFYERPDRQSDVRAVVTRLASRRAAVDAEQELELLRQRLSCSAEDDGGKNGGTAVKLRYLKRFHLKLPGFRVPHLKLTQFSVRQAAIAACIILALLGTLAVAGLARGRSPRTAAAAAVATVPSEPDAGEGRPIRVPERANGESAGKPKFRRLSPQKQTPPRTAASSASRALLPALVPLAPRERTATIPPVQALPVAPLVSPMHSPPPTATSSVNLARAATIAAPPPPSPAEPVPGYVYSAAEQNVQPARLARPQLPQEPAPTAETGYFDIIVDERGDVELVKLLSPTRRYQDRVLVAAAKAWKFTPALLNGRPVKYRVRIPIILPDIPR